MSAFEHRTHHHARPRRRRRAAAALLSTLCLTVVPAAAASAQQHGHHPPATDSATVDTTMARAHDMTSMMEGPLGLSHVRMGSGTSWMPDSSPMHANHWMLGGWTLMLHGVAFAQYDDQGSKRGDRQFAVVDWEMLMAMRKVGTGLLHLHGMASLEPATLGARGYPLLLQTGEAYRGRPLHDRQHPHDAIMELAALFQQPVARNLAVELYGGLAGEPALGPVAFMHRPSAQSDPLAPLGHHWQDATHISYGVVTAGVYARAFKLEGSAFNGREPDENRWNLDLGRLDAYSGRLTLNPSGRLSVAGWYGYLPSPEALHPEESVHRYGASALYGGRGLRGGAWGSMLLWGANAHAGGHAEHSVAAESNLEIGAKHTLFGRAEYVRKSAEDLVLPGIDAAREFDVRSLVAGYIREVASIPGGTIGVGGRASINFVPAAVGQFYGTRTPAGFSVYVRVRPKAMASPAAMEMSDRSRPRPAMPGMPGMPEHGVAHDSTAATPPPHAMNDMPGMAMPRDSSATATARDSTAHDSTAHDSTARDSTARDSTARDSTAHHEMPRDSATTRKRAPANSVKKQKAPGKPAKPPAGHHMPGMEHMPGMPMPADTARRP